MIGALTTFEAVRLIGEIIALFSVVVGGILVLSKQIMRVLTKMEKIEKTIGTTVDHEGRTRDPEPGTILARLAHQDSCTDSLKKVVESQGKEAHDAIIQHSREQTASLAQTAKETREIASSLAKETFDLASTLAVELRVTNSKTAETRTQMMERLARVEAKLSIPASPPVEGWQNES